jgi:predicted small secreted protein
MALKTRRPRGHDDGAGAVSPPRSGPGFAATVKTVSPTELPNRMEGFSMSKANAARAAVLAALLALPAVAMTACNTIEGAGQDIKNTGAWIEKKAGDKK